MVAASIRRSTAFTGVRPLEGAQDLGGVAEVLAEAFRGEMDSAGDAPWPRCAPSGGWGRWRGGSTCSCQSAKDFRRGSFGWRTGALWAMPPCGARLRLGGGTSWAMWRCCQTIAGTASGRQLMQACIERARDEGGEWVALQVRADNAPARHLYLSLGFQQTGAETFLRRKANTSVPNGSELKWRTDSQAALQRRCSLSFLWPSRSHPAE